MADRESVSSSSINPKSKKPRQGSYQVAANSITKHVEVASTKKRVNNPHSINNPQPMHTTAAVAQTTILSPQSKDVKGMTIKATYRDDMIRFDIPSLSKMADLLGKVTKRLPLNDGSFKIKYKDDEDDWVLIACDEDLQQCFSISKSLGESKIKMLVQQITK